MNKDEIKNWDDIYKKVGIVQREVMPNVECFAKLLSEKKQSRYTILDSGCGTGRHSVYISNFLSKDSRIDIESIDLSDRAILITNKIFAESGLSKQENVRHHIFVHDLNSKLPYEDYFFDDILSTLVIEHGLISQIKFWAKDMTRVLKSGGLLALAVPSVNDPRYLTGREIEHHTKIDTNQKDGKVPHHFFTEEEIEKELFESFKVIYKKLQDRPSVTADVIAQHLEYVLQKR